MLLSQVTTNGVTERGSQAYGTPSSSGLKQTEQESWSFYRCDSNHPDDGGRSAYYSQEEEVVETVVLKIEVKGRD